MLRTTAIVTVIAGLLACSAEAARFTSAEVSRAINDVRLLVADGASRPAEQGTKLSGGNSLLTGARSRAELTFPDDSIVRLGQNTAFSFRGGRREVKLEAGTLLLQQPKWRGRTEIRTAAVSAAITGTTVLLETNPDHGEHGIEKLLVIEGSMRFSLNAAPNKSMTLKPGEMVALPSNADVLPRKLVFDIRQLIKTSGLAGPDFRPLPGLDQMKAEQTNQAELKRRGELLETEIARTPRRPRFPLRRIFGRHNAQEVRNRLPEPPPPPVRVLPPAPEPERPTPPPPPVQRDPAGTTDPTGGSNTGISPGGP